MFDNSDLKQKIAIRNNIFKFDVNLDYCVEFFAGEGVLTKNFWAKLCKKVICIEKDFDKISQINCPNVEKHLGDNINFIHLSKNIEVIDCDAYGLVTDFISEVVSISQTQKKIIFFTDGFYKQQKKKKYMKQSFDNIINNINPKEYFYEKSNHGNVYYGYIYLEKL